MMLNPSAAMVVIGWTVGRELFRKKSMLDGEVGDEQWRDMFSFNSLVSAKWVNYSNVC